METFQISKYLENFTKINSAGRGTCRGCSKTVQWGRLKVASHVRNCSGFSDDEKAFFKIENQETDTTYSLIEYLKDFEMQNRKGKCRSCEQEVVWKKEKLAAHKLSSCSNVSAEEKAFFVNEAQHFPDKPKVSPYKKVAVSLKEENETTIQKEDKGCFVSCPECFICKNSLGTFKTRLVNSLDYTKTPLFEVLGELIISKINELPLIVWFCLRILHRHRHH